MSPCSPRMSSAHWIPTKKVRPKKLPQVSRAFLRIFDALRHAARALPVSPRTATKGMFVRVRITQRLSGSIDGIQLSRFEVGVTYEVGTTLANYLLAEGLAEPVDPSTPAIGVPRPENSGVVEIPPRWKRTPARSDDHPRRKRRLPKKGRRMAVQ